MCLLLVAAHFFLLLVHDDAAVRAAQKEEPYVRNHEISWVPGFSQADHQRYLISTLTKEPHLGEVPVTHEGASNTGLTSQEHSLALEYEGESTLVNTYQAMWDHMFEIQEICELCLAALCVQMSFPPAVAALMLRLKQSHQVSNVRTAMLGLTNLLISPFTSKHRECITAESTVTLTRSQTHPSTLCRQGG